MTMNKIYSIDEVVSDQLHGKKIAAVLQTAVDACNLMCRVLCDDDM
jgi:hypothetical protein